MSVPLIDVPAGLRNVAVTETTVGDVRGREGFYHYREYSAIELARTCSLEEVWYLLLEGRLPGGRELAAFRAEVAPLARLPAALEPLLPAIARASLGAASPLDGLRSALSLAASARGMRPSLDLTAEERRADALFLCAVVPALLTALYRLAKGLEPLAPRPDLGYAENYLYMMLGRVPESAHASAVERYLISTIDHGFNASTFTARVVAGTGADLGACIVAAIGALSGPLHGGAPSRALDALDAIGEPARAGAWVRERLSAGEKLMGFGHAVYRTEDPRSAMLKEIARSLGGARIELAIAVEERVLAVLDEVKPGREIRTNVEYYAGVVMERCGVPREMFTPTFAASRVIGWCANVLEQAQANKIIRPAARYVGPPPPAPVPALERREADSLPA